MKKTYEKYKKQIEEELADFFRQKKREARRMFPEMLEGIETLEEFTLRGGKRIRAILVVIGYLACNGKDLKEIIRLSTAAELLQSFFLVHDDIMDNDDFRRSGPTVHASYWKRYDKKLSESVALIIGDLAYSYAVEVITKSRFDSQKKLTSLNELVDIVHNTCYGQLLDITAGARKVDDKYIKNIHEFKTAKYTISGPLKVGAEIAGASKKFINQFDAIGIKLGRAFQLRDDILGVFGNEKDLGKPVGSDLIEGKQTFLVLQAKSDYINRKIGTKLTKDEINKIRSIIIDSGSLDYSEKMIQRLLKEGKQELQKMDIRKQEKHFLLELADYLGKRKK